MQLREYLQRHGLRSTEIRLLENELSEALGNEIREPIARELIDLYTRRLQQLMESRQSALRVGEKIDELLEEFPELGKDQVKISLAYASFQVLKKDFELWIWERGNQELSKQLTDGFSRLRTDAGETDKAITEKLLAETFDEFNAQRDELENRQAQIRYLIAWSSYYLAMLEPIETNRTDDLSIASREFLQLLQLPEGQTLATVEASWLELRSEWVCRLLVGLSLCHVASGQTNVANRGFEILTDPQVPASVFEHLSVWQFHSRFFPGQLADCRALAQFWLQHPDKITGRPSVIWSTVYISGATWPDQGDRLAGQLALTGLSGLAASNEFDIITSLTSTYPHELTEDDFFALWVTGYLVVSGSQDQSSLQKGIQLLQTALNRAATGDVDSVLSARCRIHLAFAQFQAQDYESCADNVQRIAAVLRYADPAAASRAMWLRCQALNKLATTNPLWQQPFRFALSELQNEFPDSDFARQAEFMEMMDRLQDEEHERALKTLSSVSSDSQNHDHAQYEICRLWHRRWAKTLAEQPEQAAQIAEQALQQFEDFYEQRSGSDRQEIISHLIHVCLLASDIALQTEGTFDPSTWIRRCEKWKEPIESNPIQNAELHFVKLALAVKAGDEKSILDNANWLASNSNSQQHQRTAVIQLCLNVDRRIEAAGPDVAPGELTKAIELYGRLIKLLKLQQPALAQNPNLQVGMARMANYLVRSGQPTEALEVYKELLGGFPGEVAYIDAAARLHMQSEQFDQAAELWRRIISGSRQGTDQWLNAKLQLIQCLAKTDTEMAKSVLQQTRILAPDLNEQWSLAFDQMAKQLGVNDSDDR